MADVHPVDPAMLKTLAEQRPDPAGETSAADAAKVKSDFLAVLDSAAGQQAIALLQKGELPGTGTGLLAIISAIFVYLTM